MLAALVLVVEVLAVLPSAPTQAQDRWDYRPLYAGWRAGALIGADVQGLRGDELGAVRDLVVGADGQIRAAAVEVSGMLGLGEAEFLVPWSEVEVGPDPDTVIVQAIDADVPGLIRNSAAIGRAAGAWRVSDLMGRPVHLGRRRAFGTVTDLVFGRDGVPLAVVIVPDGGAGGPYAYPWALATVDQAFGVVRLPTTPEQLQALGPFDMQRLQDGIFAHR